MEEHTSTSKRTTWSKNKVAISKQHIGSPGGLQGKPTAEDTGIGLVVIMEKVEYCFRWLQCNASAYMRAKDAYTYLSLRVNNVQTHLSVDCQEGLLRDNFLPIC